MENRKGTERGKVEKFKVYESKKSYAAFDVALRMRLRHGMRVKGAERHIIPVRGSGSPEVSI
ncbi:MAG: hypothetical protein DMG38_03895 [Acidobacteria bacterium]|nr:MAG: hypothetical protein DMG38_03895 [Acidobacteriota bacterium]